MTTQTQPQTIFSAPITWADLDEANTQHYAAKANGIDRLFLSRYLDEIAEVEAEANRREDDADHGHGDWADVTALWSKRDQMTRQLARMRQCQHQVAASYGGLVVCGGELIDTTVIICGECGAELAS